MSCNGHLREKTGAGLPAEHVRKMTECLQSGKSKISKPACFTLVNLKIDRFSCRIQRLRVVCDSHSSGHSGEKTVNLIFSPYSQQLGIRRNLCLYLLIRWKTLQTRFAAQKSQKLLLRRRR